MNAPKKAIEFTATRQADKRVVDLKWKSADKVTGCNISYGTKPDKLYLNYIVYGSDAQTIRSLNSNSGYYFQIEAFNENGISEKSAVIYVE